jgi:hypothetical protein
MRWTLAAVSQSLVSQTCFEDDDDMDEWLEALLELGLG